jgi:hypothetical protein
MKTSKVLGAAWLAFCGFFGLFIFWQLLYALLIKTRPMPGLFLYLGVFICAVYLCGIVASIFLFRGARWARGIVGFAATLTLAVSVGQIIAWPFSWLSCGIGIFALVSLVFLVQSRHEPVA